MVAKRTEVYKIGSTYYAEDPTGKVLSQSGTLETVLQAALDVGGGVYMEQNGNFIFNTTGVVIPGYTTLYMSVGTQVQPPTSSVGFTCFTIGNSAVTGATTTRSAGIVGGKITKSTDSRDWIAIDINSDEDVHGNAWALIRDTIIYTADKAITITSTNDGWIANFMINNVSIMYPNIGVEFIKGGSRDSPFRSVFDNVSIQADSTVEYGFKDVQWKDITFRDCKVWDMPTPASNKTMTIAPTAYDIKIKGGIIARRDGTSGFFINNSTSRSITIEGDDWQVPRYGDIPMTMGGIFVRNGRRMGGFEGSQGTTGWGVNGAGWTAVSGSTSATGTPSFSDGTAYRRHTTLTTLGAIAGTRYATLFTMRGWDPVYKIKFRLNQTTLNRMFLGWTSVTVDSTATDDPLNALSGVLLAKRSADTNFQIAHNEGTGVTNFIDTGVAVDTGIHTFELVATDSFTIKWVYSIDNAAWVDLPTTEIPVQGTALAIWNQVQTNESGVAKSIDIFGIYTETD